MDWQDLDVEDLWSICQEWQGRKWLFRGQIKTGRELGRVDCRKPRLSGQKADFYSKELSHNEHKITTSKGTKSPIAVFLRL